MWNAENGNKCATDGPCSKPQRNRTLVVMREPAQNKSITQQQPRQCAQEAAAKETNSDGKQEIWPSAFHSATPRNSNSVASCGIKVVTSWL
jgi:hypothetical protein